MKLIKVSNYDDSMGFFTIAVHDDFFLQNQYKPETEIFAFWAITREPIKIQTHSASQNDRQNLGFMKDIMNMAKKWLEIVVKLQFSCRKFWGPPSIYFFQFSTFINSKLSVDIVIIVVIQDFVLPEKKIEKS